MKKLSFLLALAMMISLLCVPVNASATTEGNPSGIYNVTVSDDYASSITYTVHNAVSETAIAASNSVNTLTIGNSSVNVVNFYPNGERIKIRYNNAQADSYYLILVQNDSNDPSPENIVYIDQGDAGQAEFTVYPKELYTGTQYYVYLSSNASTGIQNKTLVLSFYYYARYVVGDADDSKGVDISDATTIIDHVLGRITLTGDNFAAADVDNSRAVDISDATDIIDSILGRPSYTDGTRTK